MDRILSALVTTDPSSNYNSACQLHEDHTGQWLINSPEYADWKTGSSRFLWLYGIPGAGKTILHSYIAEDVRNLCEQTEGSACAFYYCYFARNQDETNHFLRWIIHELCRSIGGIPQVVRNNHASRGNLSRWTLVSMLETVAGYFSHVYITIDALDESADREQILAFLRTVITNPHLKHIHLLATSRKELDIDRALSPISVSLSLSNPYVDEDIRTYVKGRLLESSKFARWPESLKAETETALIKGAKGM
jgi:Cdc6-like AAA superfamily ATPase